MSRLRWTPGSPSPEALVDRRGRALPNAVQMQFGFMRCPCCDRKTHTRKVRPGQVPPSDKSTVGHDFPVARGGDPRQWFWMCWLCNNEQGVLDLVTWARKLVHSGDPRAERVVQVARFVRDWVAALKEEDAA